jgi:Tol biopolymer transport system component
LRGLGSRSFYCYRADCNYWEARAQTPDRIGGGGALAWGGGNYLYALRGNQKRSFYRYSISANSWDTLAQTLGNIKTGGSLVWTGGDYLYALRGGDHYDFYRYQISTGQWVPRASTPVPVDDGGALAYYPQGNKIYAFFGGGGYYFYAYDIVSNTWSFRRQTPGPVENGASLTYCDYSLFGGLGAGTDSNFWRYSPPVGGLDEPEPGPVPAESPIEHASVAAGDVRVGDGGAFGEELMTYDPTDKLTPDYSPSDSWITFTASDTMRNCFALYRIRSTGGLPEMVSYDSRTYENPKWSHDGAWLIAKGDDGIFRLDPSGMSAARLTQGITALPRWSESDSWVTYERWDTTLHTHRTCRVRPDGTQDTCLSADAGEYLSPQPVSDSEVVCVKLKDEVYQLCLVRNGQTIWLTSDYMNNSCPSLSPDRQWCTFEKLDESGYWQVYRIRLNGTDEARLSDGTCNTKTPTHSPDGNHIAYSKWPADSTGSSEFSQICYVPASGGQETALNPPNAIRKNPCWSNDCAYIVYQRTVESGAFGGGRKKHMQVARARTRVRYSGVEELKAIPTEFALYQNRPNPFHARTTIRYALPTRARADLTIYDIAGRSVKKLVQSEQKAGYYSVRWSGADARGRSVPAGTYFYVLKANGKIAQKRMLLVR